MEISKELKVWLRSSIEQYNMYPQDYEGPLTLNDALEDLTNYKHYDINEFFELLDSYDETKGIEYPNTIVDTVYKELEALIFENGKQKLIRELLI